MMHVLTPEIHTTDAASRAVLLRSLGRMVRGLSALFWGLPIALIICVQTANTHRPSAMVMRAFYSLAPVIATGWMFLGLWQLGGFQKQERIWINALDRAKMLALVNLGLSPFLYWWNQRSDIQFFTITVEVMAVTGMLFLANLNVVLRRLSAMLPDENLRHEAKYFTTLNCLFVLGIFLVGAAYLVLLRNPSFFPGIGNFMNEIGTSGLWVLLFLALLPLAVTMALIWKIKEVILESVFGG